MVRAGTLAAGLMTSKTNDLGEVNAFVHVQSNMYPDSVGTYESSQMKDTWIDGGDLVYVNFFKRSGIGMMKLEGRMMADGQPMDNALAGSYVAGFEGSAPRTIQMDSEMGQSVTVRTAPRPPIRITGVNGSSRENGTVDLGGPLTITLDRAATDASHMRITLLGKTVGVETFQDVVTVAGSDRIELPAGVFDHTMRARTYYDGASWLRVEEFAPASFETMPTGGMQYVHVTATDAVPVNVTGTFDRVTGISVSGEAMDIDYEMTKPIAVNGNAFEPGKRFAVVTFTVRARALSQSGSTSSTTSSAITGMTTTTTTSWERQFAQLPDAFWQNLLGQLYGGVTGAMERQADAQFIPISQVVASPAYQAFNAIESENTVDAVEQTYGGLRTLFGESVAQMFEDTSGPFANADLQRLFDDLGVDGLVAVMLDVQMAEGSFALNPSLSVQVLGPEANAWMPLGSAYARGSLMGPGQEVTNEMLEDSDQLARFLPTAINQDALLAVFETALGELVAEERANPIYEAVWRGM